MYTQVVYAKAKKMLSILNNYFGKRLAKSPSEVLIDDAKESVGLGISTDQKMAPISFDVSAQFEAELKKAEALMFQRMFDQAKTI